MLKNNEYVDELMQILLKIIISIRYVVSNYDQTANPNIFFLFILFSGCYWTGSSRGFK